MKQSAKLPLCMATSLTCGILIAATEVQWTGAGGDMDLANPANWPSSTLPESPTYSAKLTATTEKNPYTMLKATSLQPYAITLSDGLTLDLGKDHSFLSAYRVNINTVGKTYNLKSGTFGVDWSSSSGERFFIGDPVNSTGNTLNVSGTDTVLMGSKQREIQVGVNAGRQRLNVADGARVCANVLLGNAVTCHSNVVLIANAKHQVPEDSSKFPLTVGVLGGWNTYILTNRASFVSERGANVFLSNGDSRGSGHNRMIITDHSDFSTVSALDIGYCADDNGVILDNGSTLTCQTLNLASEIRAVSNVSSNFIDASGVGTKICVTLNSNIGGYSTDSELRLNDGAEMFVGDTLMFGGAGSSTNMYAYFGTNTVLDVKKGMSVCSYDENDTLKYSGIRNARLAFDHGAFYYTNSVNVARNATFNGNGVSNGVEFVNGSYGLFSSPGGTVKINASKCANGGYFKVCDSATRVQFFDQNIYVGVDEGSHGGCFLVDGGTVAITNSQTRRDFRIGNMGRGNVLEVTNGGCLTFSNMNFEVCGGGSTAVSNIVRITNRGCVEGHVSSSASDAFYVGKYGVGGLDVDGGILRVPQVLRISSTDTAANGSWVRISNGGCVEVYRVIAGETTRGNRIYIDNGVLKTLGHSINLGAASSSDCGLHIAGTNAFVRSASDVILSPKSFIQFDIGRDGLCKTSAVVSVKRNFTAADTVTDETPVTIRITDDDQKRVDGGKFTLIETQDGKIAWDKIKIECPESVRIIEKSEKKLVVRVPNHKGMLLIFR